MNSSAQSQTNGGKWRFRAWIGSVLSLGILLCTISRGNEPNDRLLAKMRESDATYCSGFRATGSEVLPPSLLKKDDESTPTVWQFTTCGDKRALVQQVTNIRLPKPIYRDPWLVVGSNGAYSLSNYVSFPGRLTERAIVYEGDTAKKRDRIATFELDEDGHTRLRGESSITDLYDVDSDTLLLFMSKVPWASGRGLSNRLSRIKSFEARPDGRECLVARGTGLSSQEGTWTLELERALDFMVRSAQFDPDSGNGAKVSIATYGNRRNDACAYPKYGVIEIGLGSDRLVYQLSFYEAALEFDGELFDHAKQRIAEIPSKNKGDRPQ